MSKQRSGLFNQRRAYQYKCCVPPPPVKTIISMNYTMNGTPENDGFFTMVRVDGGIVSVTLNTEEATNILLSTNDNNGNPIIPSLNFLNNNTLKFTLIQGATISSTIITPNSFVLDSLNNYYVTLTSIDLTTIDLTFTPNQIFINGPVTIQIETL